MDKGRHLCIAYNIPLAIMLWNEDVAYAMTPFKLLTAPVGGWPLQEYNKFALARYIISICSMSVELIMSYLDIYYGCSDMYEILDSVMIIVCAILGLVKLSMFRIYADNLICNYSSAVSDYLAIDTEAKRTIMRRHAFMGRIFFYSVVLFGIFVSLGLVTAPIIPSNKDAQVNVSINDDVLGYPISSTCTLARFHFSTTLYLVIFIVQSFLIGATFFSNLGNDSLFLAITLHVCGQMELLRIEFSDFATEKGNVNQDFMKLVTRHSYLLNLARLLADAVHFILLVQLFISSVLICIMGFQLIVALKVGDALMIAKTAMALLTFSLEMFAYSFVGNYLKNQMEEVAHSIFSCNWHCMSVKLMKNILFVIAQSQQPIQLTAGKFLVVNLQTYMSILKTSFSYLSVLRVTLDT
ncbi:odorant receptor 10-like [Linepithema humile]|uniref:odorant receptor 10-like n=1 Tax=Linepithema humile TaxID=83485 RepID=UPI00351F25E8